MSLFLVYVMANGSVNGGIDLIKDIINRLVY